MPLNLPNTWGVKKDWTRHSHSREEDEIEDEEEQIYDRQTGKMRCPHCGRWVRYFSTSEDMVQYGSVNADGDVDYGDTEYVGGFRIECPECGSGVFNSSTDELADYYREAREGR